MEAAVANQLCHCIRRAAIDNMQTNDSGHISIKLYLWTLKFEFKKNKIKYVLGFQAQCQQ